MSIHRSISSSAGQVFAVTVGNMLASLGVSESLGQTKIDDIDIMLLLSDTDKEIIGLDISVKEVSRVDKFDSLELKSTN